jgi:hypothetical protein
MVVIGFAGIPALAGLPKARRMPETRQLRNYRSIWYVVRFEIL